MIPDLFSAQPDLLDVPLLARQHGRREMLLVMPVEGGGLEYVTLEHDDIASAAAATRELLRLAEVGRQLLMAHASAPHLPVRAAMRQAREADGYLLGLMQLPLPPERPPGPPEVSEASS